MLRVIRPKFSVKDHVKAWAERKNYYCSENYQTGDGLRLEIYKPVEKDRWLFSGKYTSYEEVVKLYFYNKIGKKAAEAIDPIEEEELVGKKLFWLKAKPTYFNIVEILAEEIEQELESDDKESKIILVTMEK